MVLFFSVRGEGKCETKYKKDEKKVSGNFFEYEER